MEDDKNKIENGNETVDYGSFLSTSTEDLQNDDFDNSTADPDYYRPAINHKNAKDRTYKGRGRFVPNVHDRNIQKITKYIFCLPVAGDETSKFYVDVPEGEQAKKNIVTQAFFALKDHESVTYQQIAKDHFSRKMYHWMLYLIMQDDQEPDLAGLVKIFRFGKKIDGKIEYESKPDASVQKTSEIAVHDPFKGKDLILHINEITNDRGQKMTSYDQSKFDDLSSISLDCGKTRLEKNQENMKIIFEFLKENSPDLSKCAHKAWTDDEEERIIKTVQFLVDDDTLFNQIYKKAYGKNFFTNAPKSTTAKSESRTTKKEDSKPNDTVNFEDDSNSGNDIAEDNKSNAITKETNTDIDSVKKNVITEDKPNAGDENPGGDDSLSINVEFEEDN